MIPDVEKLSRRRDVRGEQFRRRLPIEWPLGMDNQNRVSLGILRKRVLLRADACVVG